ncbi:MAG: metallophosphoesterase family protein [Thermoleophilia bacterium]|nr:metallophosphoesterase family protein [Thermoleophilia bacterium]
MQVACLADVHGNAPALEAVLAQLERDRVDVAVVAGDAFLGPMPRRTYELLQTLGERARFLVGNTDRAIFELPVEDPWLDRAAWCARELGGDAVAWLRRLPATVTIDVPGLGTVCFCHATPRSDEEIVTLVTPDDRLSSILAGVEADVVVAGHTHSQLDRRAGGIRFVNAGSVGMPYEREPGAYWALLGPGVELRRTPYDAAAAAERIRASGFPEADAFAEEYVLSLHAPDETAPYFERMAEERDQAANSEK